jgi:toxin ParE1/3/4
MSVPERQLVLSPAALDDLTDILQYTLATWGEEQMVTYSQMLDSRLSMILENPQIGFQRPAISERHRFVVAGEHLIAYRISALTVEVSRILHGRMDFRQSRLD